MSGCFTATWIVKHFSFFEIENGEEFDTPYFTPENIDKSRWFICIYVTKKKYVSLRLHKLACEKDKAVDLDVEMELCNSENEVLCTTVKKREILSHRTLDCYFTRLLLLEELNKKLKETSEDTLIVRCRMFATAEGETVQSELNRSCTLQTAQCLDESSFVRKVSYSESPDWSEKLTFPLNEKGKLDVNIKAPQDDILFEITKDDQVTRLKMKCAISLLNYEPSKKLSRHDIFIFSENFRIFDFPPFLKRSMLRKGTSFLNLKFAFAFSTGSYFYNDIDETKLLSLSPSPKVLKNTSATNSLADDMRKMLLNKKHADVSFCVDGEVISAHKNILASRSPVFSAMFDQQMAENETGVIDIQDMDIQTLELLLEFLYTGDLEKLDYETMLKLLLAAENYQVPSLKEKCSQCLKRQLSLDNVCDVVCVADKVGEQNLKAAAIACIKNNVAKVFSSSKWSVLTDKNVKLCSEIFCNVSENLKEKDTKK